MEQRLSKSDEMRRNFKSLLLKNPNYFGNLVESAFEPAVKVVADTRYEELTCIGFNPFRNLLEATIAIKLPYGYGGDLCSSGTTEYVRFFIDYGSGWEDLGYTGVVVHDIPSRKDCADESDKPLMYVATLKLEPKTECCDHPVLPKIHAILSWQEIPPAGPSNVGWQPPWGNSLERYVQIRPHPWNIYCMLEKISSEIGKKIKVPPLFESVKELPIPLPDPPPFTLAELAKMYVAKSGSSDVSGKFVVDPHRFGTADIHTFTSVGGFSQDALSAKIDQWKSLGLNLAEVVAALEETQADVSYEQLECLGIDEDFPERVVATFRVKRPTGYCGNLCQKGSQEYIAFWADWDNTCEWTYLGTATVSVHDIPDVSDKKNLWYSAILPVDLKCLRRSCKEPKIARLRAVLSWAVPPSTTDPNKLNYWGNRLDTHVQVNPGDIADPENPLLLIRNIGGIPIELIDTGSSGMTTSNAIFAHFPERNADGWNLGRPCPFGGIIRVEGNYYEGFRYRARVHKCSDPLINVTTLSEDFWVERSDVGFDHQVPDANGWFTYRDPVQEFDRTLAIWHSFGDDKWEIQLQIQSISGGQIVESPWYVIQLDNTPPTSPLTMDIHIDGSGDCKDINQGTPVTGYFIANDLHFGGWSLSTEPNTAQTLSNQPKAIPYLANTDPAPAPAGHDWSLDTNNPVKMKPCGYVVRLDVSDRSILHSMPFQHNSNHIEVGFCLRETPEPDKKTKKEFRIP